MSDNLFGDRDWTLHRWLYVMKVLLPVGHPGYPKPDVVKRYEEQGLKFADIISLYYIGQATDVERRLLRHNTVPEKIEDRKYPHLLAPDWKVIFQKYVGYQKYQPTCETERRYGDVYVDKSAKEMIEKYNRGEEVLLDRIIFGPNNNKSPDGIKHYTFFYPDNAKAIFPNAELFLAEKRKNESEGILKEVKIIDKTEEECFQS